MVGFERPRPRERTGKERERSTRSTMYPCIPLHNTPSSHPELLRPSFILSSCVLGSQDLLVFPFSKIRVNSFPKEFRGARNNCEIKK